MIRSKSPQARTPSVIPTIPSGISNHPSSSYQVKIRKYYATKSTPRLIFGDDTKSVVDLSMKNAPMPSILIHTTLVVKSQSSSYFGALYGNLYVQKRSRSIKRQWMDPTKDKVLDPTKYKDPDQRARL